MSTTVTYKCDRCGHEQGDGNQMWKVGICFAHFGSTMSSPRTADWCRKCIDETNIFRTGEGEREDPLPIPAGPTVEDMIREIVRDEMSS